VTAQGAPYVGNEARIVLSFAMANHGANFAYWLRDKLMKRLNYYSPNAVYLDCIAARLQTTQHYAAGMAPASGDQVRGITYVSPDTRPHLKSQGYMPIGASNVAWEAAFDDAVSQAAAMILVVTSEYLQSQWCMLEWRKCEEENQRRRGVGKAPLRGVALVFPPSTQGQPGGTQGGATNGMPANNSQDIQQIAVTKVYGRGGLLWHPEDYAISEAAFDRVVIAAGL